MRTKHTAAVLAVFVIAIALIATPTSAADKKPNILIIWGDDIGEFNISAYNMGMMGYKTPNIDSIAKQGALFTDWYGQQSCTAGRAAFITGQSPIRTGLTKVGLPGAPEGLTKADPTLAELLKPLGYVTGQFGKNHLGDRNDMLPTVHGFDEWLGNLYHLNAEEEPENVDYPKDPAFKAKFGPRGVLHCFATDKDDATDDPRFGKVGKQKCEDTGPLTKKRMETVDEEVTAGALKFMDKAVKADKPFFIWWNSSRMHVFTHLKKESPKARPASASMPTAWSSTTARSASCSPSSRNWASRTTPSSCIPATTARSSSPGPMAARRITAARRTRNGKAASASPTLIRWPGVIKPGTIINDIGAHEDMIPTLLAAAGDTTVKEDLLKGRKIGDMTYKVHLDGYNLLPFLKGEVKESPRHEFIYWTDDGSVAALRYDNWKITFLRQNSVGIKVWETPFEELRWPMLTNLRMDPFERATDESVGYPQWAAERMFVLAPAAAYRRPVAAELPRIPAAHEARQLQPRPRDGSGDRTAKRQQLKSERSAALGEPIHHRVPKIFAHGPVRAGGHHFEHFYDWLMDHVYLLVPAQACVASSWRPSGLSSAAEGGQLEPGCSSSEDAESSVRNSDGGRYGGSAPHYSHEDATDEKRTDKPHLTLFLLTNTAFAADPLPSWNDGAAKKSIIDFVDEGDDSTVRRTSCRCRSASPRSTTTARSGASSRCPCNCSSHSTA